MSSSTSDTPGGVRVMQRRTLLKTLGVAGAGAGLATLPRSASAAPGPGPGPDAASGKITAAGVDRAVQALPGIIDRDMAATGIPGLAIAVVYDGKVRYIEGHGVRKLGRPERVDADTVFYLASVSKPVSATVVGAALTKKLTKFSWRDPIASQLPKFTLADKWVGSHVTVADMFSHRSGLPDHAGGLLEDLGYGREEITAKLALYPLKPFRDNYKYTNNGLTVAAQAVAVATRRSWSKLSDELIFGPLGMPSSSFTYAGLKSRTNRAALHRKVRGKFQAFPDADYEPEAPAGGASSSVRDMAIWLTMLLADGRHNGVQVVDPGQLNFMWSPAFMNKPPAKVGAWGSFYGMGWNVSYQKTGELQVGHSGAFGRGAATSVIAYPADKLAMVVLTNSAPEGVPEAVGAEFLDVLRYGSSTQDWLKVIAPAFAEEPTADQTKYAKGRPARPAPARTLTSYTGTYASSLYGDLTVSTAKGGLTFTVGPAREQHALTSYSGDEFFFETTGEDASGFSGALFRGTRSRITSVTINAWNKEGLGTFTRR